MSTGLIVTLSSHARIFVYYHYCSFLDKKTTKKKTTKNVSFNSTFESTKFRLSQPNLISVFGALIREENKTATEG